MSDRDNLREVCQRAMANTAEARESADKLQIERDEARKAACYFWRFFRDEWSPDEGEWLEKYPWLKEDDAPDPGGDAPPDSRRGGGV